MKIKWKIFRDSFPHICKECGTLASMDREYCESCGVKGSLRHVTKEDYAKYLTEMN